MAHFFFKKNNGICTRAVFLPLTYHSHRQMYLDYLVVYMFFF